jgi:NDP-sugar pyrophosphorylase family protein
MTVIITMAGEGKRFREHGYSSPKFMIPAKGRPLFDWSMLSLTEYFDQPFIFACLSSHDPRWIYTRAVALGIRRVAVEQRPGVSLGQAQTAYDAITCAALGDELWIYNIDTYIKTGASPSQLANNDGCIHVFESTSPAMSYVRKNNADSVVEIVEKQVISRWASVGLYGFKTANLFRSLYERTYRNQISNEAEQYIAPLFQSLLESGGSVCAPRLNNTQVHILGTPQDLLLFDRSASPTLEQ